MQGQTWVNAVAVAVVVASLVTAWRSTHPGKKKRASTPKGDDPKTRPAKSRPKIRRMMRHQRAWLLLRNEAEIARRGATASATGPPPTDDTFSDERSREGRSGTDPQAR